MMIPALPLDTIIHGDSLEEMRKLPDGCIDLIFTSPPYNLKTTTGGGFPESGGVWQNSLLKLGYDDYEDALTYPEYIEWQKQVLAECWRLLASNGAIYYNHKPRVQDCQLQTPLDLNPGLPVRQIVIWRHNGRVNYAPTHYVPTHEWIVIFAKPNFRLRDKSVSSLSDVWEVPNELNRTHPAPFPVALPLRAINSTNCKIVLDPFMGSGSTAIACINADHLVNYIGIEKSTKYIKQANERIRLAKAQGRFSFDELGA